MISVGAAGPQTVLVTFDGNEYARHETFALAHELAAECFRNGIAVNARVEVWSPGVGNAWLRVTTKDHAGRTQDITTQHKRMLEDMVPRVVQAHL